MQSTDIYIYIHIPRQRVESSMVLRGSIESPPPWILKILPSMNQRDDDRERERETEFESEFERDQGREREPDGGGERSREPWRRGSEGQKIFSTQSEMREATGKKWRRAMERETDKLSSKRVNGQKIFATGQF